MIRPILQRFLEDPSNDYERAQVLAALTRRPAESRTFEFNIYNVDLDFDAGLVTVEDVLGHDRDATLPVTQFRALLDDARRGLPLTETTPTPPQDRRPATI